MAPPHCWLQQNSPPEEVFAGWPQPGAAPAAYTSRPPRLLCANDPASAAQRLVDGGFTPRHDYAMQTLSELPYDKWR